LVLRDNAFAQGQGAGIVDVLGIPKLLHAFLVWLVWLDLVVSGA
jgi:hypothetical protein